MIAKEENYCESDGKNAKEKHVYSQSDIDDESTGRTKKNRRDFSIEEAVIGDTGATFIFGESTNEYAKN